MITWTLDFKIQLRKHLSHQQNTYHRSDTHSSQILLQFEKDVNLLAYQTLNFAQGTARSFWKGKQSAKHSSSARGAASRYQHQTFEKKCIKKLITLASWYAKRSKFIPLNPKIYIYCILIVNIRVVLPSLLWKILVSLTEESFSSFTRSAFRHKRRSVSNMKYAWQFGCILQLTALTL